MKEGIGWQSGMGSPKEMSRLFWGVWRRENTFEGKLERKEVGRKMGPRLRLPKYRQLDIDIDGFWQYTSQIKAIPRVIFSPSIFIYILLDCQ